MQQPVLVKKWNLNNIFILRSLFCLFSKNPKLYFTKFQSSSNLPEKFTLQHPTFEIFHLKLEEYLAQHIRLDRIQIFTVWQRVRTRGRRVFCLSLLFLLDSQVVLPGSSSYTCSPHLYCEDTQQSSVQTGTIQFSPGCQPWIFQLCFSEIHFYFLMYCTHQLLILDLIKFLNVWGNERFFSTMFI